ncbi:MAG: hypothetical protein OEL83_18030 [Desulforhopalus sp.]|nr:hypothetical protein [Desulforhopalus sp.]
MNLQSQLARYGFFCGCVITGIVLGILLSVGIIELLSLSEGVRIFRYEGF